MAVKWVLYIFEIIVDMIKICAIINLNVKYNMVSLRQCSFYVENHQQNRFLKRKATYV